MHNYGRSEKSAQKYSAGRAWSINLQKQREFRADYSYARSRHPYDMRAFRRSVLAGARRVTISNTLLTLGFLNSLLARFLARSESFLNQVAISSSAQPLSLSLAFALDRERCRLSMTARW
jgi:hypothetical protein